MNEFSNEFSNVSTRFVEFVANAYFYNAIFFLTWSYVGLVLKGAPHIKTNSGWVIIENIHFKVAGLTLLNCKNPVFSHTLQEKNDQQVICLTPILVKTLIFAKSLLEMTVLI